jgi:TonB family protein
MPRWIAAAFFMTAAAVLLGGCAAGPKLAANPYANCVDLGELSLSSSSRADAEQQMRARVHELGGDTLIFGERGRFGRAGSVPDEVARRRDVLLGAHSGDNLEAPVAGAVEPAAEPAQTGPQRRGKVTAQPVEPLAGELWYYGAALRCNRTGSAVLADAGEAPAPLVRIAPEYPEGDGVGTDGEVSLEFTISATGTTKDIVVVTSSSTELEAPAVAALVRWRFAPLVDNGTPTERRAVHTTIRFQRRRDPA